MIIVHYITRQQEIGSAEFASDYGAHSFERYLDAIGASYQREGV